MLKFNYETTSGGEFFGFLFAFYLFWPICIYAPYILLLLLTYITGKKFYYKAWEYYFGELPIFATNIINNLRLDIIAFLSIMVFCGLYPVFDNDINYEGLVYLKHAIFVLVILNWVSVTLRRTHPENLPDDLKDLM